MTAFLKQVANHYYTDGNISRLCFVFPNKRSAVFFRKHLSDLVRESGQAVAAPRTITINQFFYTLTGSVLTDRLQLLAELHKCYKALNPKAEELDDFLYWGGVILSDFDDIDKYLADPDKLLRNISDFRQMQDDFSYLSEPQREAMDHFFRMYLKAGVAAEGKKDYKEEFRKVWDLLLPLYHSFNEALKEKGLCYEGMVYRKLADSLEDSPITDKLADRFPECDKFIFTGLNALNKCERALLSKMDNAGLAEFCWDYSSSQIKDPQNKSSHFLADFSTRYRQAFTPDQDSPLKIPEVNAVSISSSVGQAKLLPEIFSRLGGKIGIETAVVLPDEGLLLPALNSIPPEINEINVTMGYPVAGSEFFALMNGIAGLQEHMREKDGNTLFYHRQVWGIFSNGVFKKLLSDEEKDMAAKVRSAARLYIPQEELCAGNLTSLVFKKAGEDILQYEKDIILAMAPMLEGSLEQEFAMLWYKALTRMQDLHIDLKPATWVRLISKAVAGESIPFKGEPLAGLQIMGPLETRALDFKNLIILSFNEGVFPRHNVASSFIPAEIRKGFDLPTYEHQDAVWAYYFYRLIQRAEKVWLVSDSRPEVSRSGEESRYIKQLEMLYGVPVHRYVMKAGINAGKEEDSIPKTPEHIEKMRSRDFHLSATALKNYLNCPAKFFYEKIEGLKAPEDVAESMDNGMIGTVVHESMSTLYSESGELHQPHPVPPMKRIGKAYLKILLEPGNKRIEQVADTYIKDQMKGAEISGRNLVIRSLIISYIRKIIETDINLLGDSDSFECYGLEEFRSMDMDGFNIVGYIDRLDSFDDRSLRIVDYKTGQVKDEDIGAGKTAEKIAEKLFGETNKDRPTIALQLFIYGLLTRNDFEGGFSGMVRQNCIYQTSRLFSEGKPMQSVPDPEFEKLAEEGLHKLLAEIASPEHPWRRKSDKDTCKWCDFKIICGK